MVNSLFPDFQWFIDFKKKKRSIENAIQIQYLVEKVGDRVQVQAINTFSRGKDARSGAPVFFNLKDFDLLKLCTMKQWALALTWEGFMKKLHPKSLSLLAGYILYYEKILDDVMETGNMEILEKWFEIEIFLSGRHMEDLHPEDAGEENAMEMDRVEVILSSWNMGSLFEITDTRNMDGETKEGVFFSVKKWLRGQWEKNEESNIVSGTLVSTKGKEKEKKDMMDVDYEMEYFTGRTFILLYKF